MGTDNDIISNEEELIDERNEDMQIDNLDYTLSDDQHINQLQDKVKSWYNTEKGNTFDKFLERIDNVKDNDYSSLHQLLDIYLEYNISRENCINLKFNLYFRENRTAEALELLERYKDDVGDRYHALRVKIYIEEKKYKEGLDYIDTKLPEKISKNLMKHPQIVGYKLVCLYYLGKYKEVIRLYKYKKYWNGNVLLQFLYRHLYLLSCIIAGNNKKRDDEKKDEAFEEILLLKDNEFKKKNLS